jgi:hypothetical protein
MGSINSLDFAENCCVSTVVFRLLFYQSGIGESWMVGRKRQKAFKQN